MKIEEMRNLSIQELEKQIQQAHQELFNLRIRHATKQLVNHREIPKVKKKIARLNTVLREKQLGIEVKHGSQS
ncbi:MAG: 50S ribosomal protein L29 [Dehalococcoidia bacterium]|nr:50S ribosomal protein L29 [Dehalococcoidia bacterium]